MIKNAVGRELPESIGTYRVRPFAGVDAMDCSSAGPVVSNRRLGTVRPGEEKLKPDLRAAILASGLADGMTISFHHSFREGDQVIGQVLAAIRELGIKNLKFAPSAVVNIKNPSIVDFVKDGTITRIEASGIRGEMGDAVLNGMMEERGVTAAMALGGIPAAIVNMYRKGLVRAVACSQSFDAVAAKAIVEEPGIIEIDNSLYANPARKGCMLNRETFGVLAALEVDTDFNVNILTGCNGQMMGGLGGGPDVAGGAEISIVVLPIVRGRIPSVVKRVFTCCTPGETVAAVVTEAGIALNPRHKNYRELKEDLGKTNLKLVTIEELRQQAEALTGVPKPIECTDRIACVVEYRDGTVIDVIHALAVPSTL